MGGAGGSLRAGVTENPVRLTRSVRAGADDRDLRRRAGLSSGRAAASPSWSTSRCCPRIPSATCRRRRIVAPIEFTMRLDDYAALGGHVDEVRPLEEVVAEHAQRRRTHLRQRRRGRAPLGCGGARHEDAGRSSDVLPTASLHLTTGRSTSSSRPSASRAPSKRPTRRRGGASRRSSTSCAPSCLCCARRSARRPAPRGVGRAPDGGGGRAVPRAALHHADGRGRRRGRRGDPRGHDDRRDGSPAPMSTTAATSRSISAPGETFRDRPGRSPGPARALVGRATIRADGSGARHRHAAAGAAAASRSASPTR